jgi:chorismate mutase
MAFPKIMEHPDKNRIVKWLRDGKGVRWVSKTLREMYPDDPDKRLSVPTLQAFRKEHLKLEGDVLEDLKKTKRQQAGEKALQKEHTQVRNLPTYKEKLAEIVDLHIDIKRGLVAMEKLITSRLEDLFDAAARGDITIDKEKLLQGYFDRYFMMIDKWAKYVDKVADFKVEANINVTVVQDQMAVLRQAVHELVREMDPELALSFLDRLNERMRGLNYKSGTPPTARALTAMRNEVAALPDAEIVDFPEDGDAD